MILLNVDTQTWIITIVGWLIVLSALIVLVIFFTNVQKLFKIKTVVKPKHVKNGAVSEIAGKKYISGDETAAIAMALHLYFDEQHDEESNVITIKQIQRRYSPWSSKIFGMRNLLN